MKKLLTAGMIAIACTTLITAPTAFAKGNGNAGSNRVVTNYQGLEVAEGEALLFMREEEKLARDVYITLYQQWKLPAFNNISASEQQHTDRIKLLIQTYGLIDPVVNDAVGAFANGQLASLYAQLLAKGRTSALNALQVGAMIEETDIADLQKAITGTTHPDIAAVYENLMKGSRNHLRAFVGLIENQGIAYTAQALPQAEVDAIINSPRERGNNANGGGRGQGAGMGNRRAGNGGGGNMPAFADFDTDKDGYLSEVELNTGRAQRMAAQAADGRLLKNAANAEPFADIDTSKDGKIDPAEFAAHQLKHHGSAPL